MLFGENIDYYYSRMLDKLVELKGIEVVFLFLANLSKTADIIFKNAEDSAILK